MSEFEDIVTDIAEITEADGVDVLVTRGTNTFRVRALWEDLSLEGGEQSGPKMWVANADMPTGWTQSDTVEKDGTTYTISHKEPDGFGLVEVTLTDESAV